MHIWLMISVSLLALFDKPSPVPPARIYAAGNGQYGCFVRTSYKNPEPAKVTLRMFTFDREGKEVDAWVATVDWIPGEVFVSQDGAAVLLDQWKSTGHAHALVVINRLGKVVGDYALEDLLSPEEIKQNVLHTESSRVWAMESTKAFAEGKWTITLLWGRRIEADLATGKLVRK
jgi:hypothetical protein